MTCPVCGEDFKDGIAGKCRRCYNREWEKIHPRKYRRPSNINPCSVCGRSPTVSKGLCETHYARLRRLGKTDLDKPEMWGEMILHPLYSTWDWMHSRKTSPICERWASSFYSGK